MRNIAIEAMSLKKISIFREKKKNQQVVRPRGINVSNDYNDLDCPIIKTASIENIEVFSTLSNQQEAAAKQPDRTAQTKIAAPTVIGSSNQSSRVITTQTPYQIEESDAMRTAALWYAANHTNRSGAFIPFIRETFGLTALDAIRAMQLGRKLAREARQ